MLYALVGAVMALVALSRWHDRQLERLHNKGETEEQRCQVASRLFRLLRQVRQQERADILAHDFGNDTLTHA